VFKQQIVGTGRAGNPDSGDDAGDDAGKVSGFRSHHAPLELHFATVVKRFGAARSDVVNSDEALIMSLPVVAAERRQAQEN
ncbi:MAG: hypothetical protein VB853_13850, partial [Pirellulales bacterium]